MLRLDRVIRPWRESGALNSQINLYGFWNEQAFLTKSGDLGIILRVRGVDYESLDQTAQEYAVKRLEAALKTFGVGFHVYQYLFKTNRPEIPFQQYQDPIVQTAVDQRKEFFREKLDCLFDIDIFYAIVIEGTRSKTGIAAALSRLPYDPKGGLQELKTQFLNDRLKILLREQIEGDLFKLEQRVGSFVRQLSDFVQLDILSQRACFRFLRRLLNYDAWRIEGHPKSTQFLDYQVANSDIEADRDHLRVGDHYVRVLTIKDAISETKPLVLKQLLEIQANFCVVTEWVPIDNAIARKEITKRKRHFNVSKSSFISSVHSDGAAVNPRDVLIDESKQADIENLGDCLRVLGDGQSLGDFSFTIILHADDKKALDRVLPDVVRIFTSADGSLFCETYNQLNAYFAIVPGNYRHNLRKLFLLNSNYADISFLFTVHPGQTWNRHLDREYVAVLETDNATPYYLNLHEREVAHTLILGATGSGKNMKLEEVNTRTKEAVDFLVAALESGHSEVLTAYLGAMAKFHTYSFGNIMLIARQKPDATNVAGLRTWNSLGRFVKRGEKGIFILAPMVGRRSTKDVSTDEPSQDATTEGQRTLYGFRAVYVFDRLSRDLRASLCALDGCRECHFREPPR
jgi:N-terminal domain of anti-restriction factor ArdC